MIHLSGLWSVPYSWGEKTQHLHHLHHLWIILNLPATRATVKTKLFTETNSGVLFPICFAIQMFTIYRANAIRVHVTISCEGPGDSDVYTQVKLLTFAHTSPSHLSIIRGAFLSQCHFGTQSICHIGYHLGIIMRSDCRDPTERKQSQQRVCDLILEHPDWTRYHVGQLGWS